MRPQELYRLAFSIFLISGISQLYALTYREESLLQPFEAQPMLHQQISAGELNQSYISNSSDYETKIETIYIEEKEEDDDERDSIKKSVEGTQSIIFLFYTYPQDFLRSTSRIQIIAKQLYYSLTSTLHIALKVFRI